MAVYYCELIQYHFVMIYFIRHGESEANLKHTFAGQKDDSIHL